ncbi:MAG: hypothetical protein WAV20_26555, partial [Blastocatellia bacterium]
MMKREDGMRDAVIGRQREPKERDPGTGLPGVGEIRSLPVSRIRFVTPSFFNPSPRRLVGASLLFFALVLLP